MIKIIMKRYAYYYLLWSILSASMLWAHTAGHEHDQERELMAQALFAISWPSTTGLQSGSILTATTPAALLIWSYGSAIILDASAFMQAGLRLDKAFPAGYWVDIPTKQIVISASDLSTLRPSLKYKDAVLSDYLMLHSNSLQYNKSRKIIYLSVGDAYAVLPIHSTIGTDHHVYPYAEDEMADHIKDEVPSNNLQSHVSDFLLGRSFWAGMEPLQPNQHKRLGYADVKLHLQIVLNAKPLKKAGLKPELLHNVRYEVEHYGLFNWFKHERLIIDFYL